MTLLLIPECMSTSPKFKYIEDVPLDVRGHYERISTIADWHFVAIEFGSIQGKDESMRVPVSRCKDRSETKD